MRGSTIDDPLSDTYKKLGCSISPLDKNSNDYEMIVKYLEKTYEPVKIGDTVRIELCFFVCYLQLQGCANLIECLLPMNFRNMGCQLKTSSLWNRVLALPMKTY